MDTQGSDGPAAGPRSSGRGASAATPLHRVAAPLRQQLIELLREAILSFEYQPGERLVERTLCERYEISRTVVREALRHLEAEGLVAMVPNRGPVVVTVTAGEARALYEVRGALESLAAKLFALRASAGEQQRLRDAADAIELAFADGRLVQGVGAKDDFYDVLVDGAHNDVIRSTLRTVHARIRMLRGLSLQAEGRPSEAMREIRAIVDAVDARDPEAASRACETHVQRAAEVALGQLRSEAASTESTEPSGQPGAEAGH